MVVMGIIEFKISLFPSIIHRLRKINQRIIQIVSQSQASLKANPKANEKTNQKTNHKNLSDSTNFETLIKENKQKIQIQASSLSAGRPPSTPWRQASAGVQSHSWWTLNTFV